MHALPMATKNVNKPSARSKLSPPPKHSCSKVPESSQRECKLEILKSLRKPADLLHFFLHEASGHPLAATMCRLVLHDPDASDI